MCLWVSHKDVFFVCADWIHTGSKCTPTLFKLQLLEGAGALAALCGALRLPPQVTRASAAAEPLAVPVRRQSSTVRSLCRCASVHLLLT